MPIQRVRSKWAKTEALLASPELKEHVPDTRKFDRQTVLDMLHRYGMIYVKPVNGTFGRGVIRVEYDARLAEPCRFQFGERIYADKSFDRMYEKLLKVKLKRPYLVQQGIELLRHNNRRFDLRIMVQKNPSGDWESTGMIGRMSHPRKIVTNYHNGGTPMPVETLLQPHCPEGEYRQYRDKLKEQGVKVAAALETRFPRLKEIGIDVAIDTELKPWILEVNTLPDPFIFLKLPNPRVFRRIYAYAVSYGRYSGKKQGKRRK